MTDREKEFRLKIEELAAIIDYRDAATLRWAASEIDIAIERIKTRVDEQWRLWVYSKDRLRDLVQLRDGLRNEATSLDHRIDFEVANEARVRGENPNPEVPA